MTSPAQKQDLPAVQVDKKKILVIDDEKDFGKMIKLCLEKYGLYSVDTSFAAEEGIKKIAQSRYDLIILDVLMPKMEGHEALKRIKAISRTPVVILSAYLSPLLEKEIVRYGAFACLKKPVELDEVVLVLHKALSAG